MTRSVKRENHAVVLAGGGANGAYAIGVMEALFNGCWHGGQQEPVDASIFTGTSVGGFTAALMASLFDRSCLAAVREVRRLWVEQISASSGAENGVFQIRGVLEHALADAADLAWDGCQRFLDLALSGEPLGQRFTRLFHAGNLISTRPLEKLILRTIDPRRLVDPRARSLKVITTNWDEGQVVVFQNRPENEVFQPIETSYGQDQLTIDNARLAIQASAAIPGLFPSVRIGDHVYVDGGVTMNAPLQPAIQAGGSILHVIHFDPELDPVPFGRPPSLIETLNRIAVTVPANEVKEGLAAARHAQMLRSTARRLRPIWRQLDEGLTQGESEVRGFVRDYGEMRKLIIHVYYPSRSVGGIAGLLNFHRDRIVQLIELGYDDAVHHDCQANGCVV